MKTDEISTIRKFAYLDSNRFTLSAETIGNDNIRKEREYVTSFKTEARIPFSENIIHSQIIEVFDLQILSIQTDQC